MASVAQPATARRERFFLYTAIAMAALNAVAFSFHYAMGRSTFTAPMVVHAHAVVFMGWVTIYLVQNLLVASNAIRLHRRLGWVAAGWMGAMVVAGFATLVAIVQRGTVPFFFTPAYFLVMDALSLLIFAALGVAAIRMRRRTDWHRRLNFCGMAVLMGPAIGRLLPLPFLIPWAGLAVFSVVILFPLAGVAADLRRSGRVHPAYLWGLATIAAMQLAIEVIGRSDAGAALATAIAAGSPGEAIDSRTYPAPPPLP